MLLAATVTANAATAVSSAAAASAVISATNAANVANGNTTSELNFVVLGTLILAVICFAILLTKTWSDD